MKYKYFVSYSFTNGTGFNVIEKDSKIKSYNDILEIKEVLEKNDKICNDNVVILNIQRLPI